MDPIIGSAIIGGVGNLLGGIFGRKSAKKAAARERAQALEDDRLRFQRTAEAAELGGYNPLTALGLGGSGLGGNMPSGGLAPLTAAAFTQDMIQGVSRELSGEASIERQREQLGLDLAKLQIEQLTADLAVGDERATAGRRGGASSGVNNPIRAAGAFGGGLLEQGVGEDAQVFEDRYGEAGGMVAGIGNMLDTGGIHLRNSLDEQLGRPIVSANRQDEPWLYIDPDGVAGRAAGALGNWGSGVQAGLGQLWGNATNFWGR